jgi:beta-glucosidase
VYAPGGNAVPGIGLRHWPGPEVYAHSSPLEALRAELPEAVVEWQEGTDPKAAAAAAKRADVVIVFATQWTAEALDFPLELPNEQDALIDAVGRVNRRTVVVLETGGPVLMPWLNRAAAVIEAWYPGSQGGPAIARVLSGAVNPSGHLPATFPRTAEQLPRSSIAGNGAAMYEGIIPAKADVVDVRYDEGAAVGYRWYDLKQLEPLFPFGHGLSYTTFARDGLAVRAENEHQGDVRVSFRVRNTGARAGHDVAQIYVSPMAGGWDSPKHLAGFAKTELAPGATRDVSVRLEPKVLARWDARAGAFRIAAGEYRVTLASSARDPGQSVIVTLAERVIAKR